MDPPTLHFRHPTILMYLKLARIHLSIDHFLQVFLLCSVEITRYTIFHELNICVMLQFQKKTAEVASSQI